MPGKARSMVSRASVSDVGTVIEVRGMTCEGVDDPYEVPTDADLVVDVSQQTVPEIVHSMSNKSAIII